MSTLVLPFINFFILLGVLVYYLRQPLRDFVQARHKTLLEDLKVTQAQLHNAQIQYEDFSAKLKALDAEVAAFKSQLKREGETAKAEIISESKKMAAYIVKEAQLASENLYSELRSELFRELGLRVVGKAEQLMRTNMKAEDKASLHKEFIQQLGESR